MEVNVGNAVKNSFDPKVFLSKVGNPQLVSPNISQETLAEMIGTTRSRVSFFMNKFRKLGLISYNGKIEVHNSLLNAVLHEKPEIEREEPTSKV
jgi:CRP/FNR family transcriptional regulator, cyclic AMP receptor protein